MTHKHVFSYTFLCMEAALASDDELAHEISEQSTRTHAAMARICRLAAAYDSSEAWATMGTRSCAHWLTVTAGFDLRTSSEVVRVGHAVERLPAIARAFDDGRLSFDKVRALTTVATAEDELMWLRLALDTAGAQVARICRAVRSALDVNDPRRADDELAHRGVRCWWRADGMLELIAVLPREDGAVVMAALDAVTKDLVEERRTPARLPGSTVPEKLRKYVLQADALVRISEQHLAATSPEPAVAPTRQMVIHVDSSVLRKQDAYGRCHIEDGPALSPSAARWLACDADVVTITERDGLPIDVGRAQRVIPPRLRLALHARDRGCRYPGCGVPAKRCEGHHVSHWPDGGRTELHNCLLLCRFHHRRHHEGKFVIRVIGPGEFSLERADGTPIVRATPAPGPQPP